MNISIELRVNGQLRQATVLAHETLLDVLRNKLNLTGTKKGCDEGDCGACTVLIDNKPVNSCIVLAVEVQGRDIIMIEGLSLDGKLHPVQQAFVEQGAVQCGFCTPGMILTAKALLDENPQPREDEIRHYMAGNLCRCTGYSKIVEAVLSVAVSQRGKGKGHETAD
jgi:carbon-monoxide dehydrogenase small subunit